MNSDEKLVVRTKKNDTLGNFIQECRQRYGWTQEELGWRTGITREHVGRIERGKCIPSVQTLYDLEKALNLPECSLVTVQISIITLAPLTSRACRSSW